MDKQTFLSVLRKELASLPAVERDELLTDYEAHFTFGEQSGKTEEDIVRELGNPQEIAREAYGDPNARSVIREVSVARTIFAIVGLFFLNIMIMLPVALAIWSAWVSLSVSGLAAILSPLAAMVSFALNQSFSGMKLFISLVMSGLGIFIAMAAYYSGKYLVRVTMIYILWNYRVMKGEQ